MSIRPFEGHCEVEKHSLSMAVYVKELRDCFGESPSQYSSQGTAETQEEEVSGKNRNFLLGVVG